MSHDDQQAPSSRELELLRRYPDGHDQQQVIDVLRWENRYHADRAQTLDARLHLAIEALEQAKIGHEAYCPCWFNPPRGACNCEGEAHDDQIDQAIRQIMEGL